MGQRCTICDSGSREEIDRALVGGEGSARAIAKRFAVSRQALNRHRTSHLPKTLVTATRAHEVARADDLMSKAAALEVDARRLLSKAETRGELRTSVAAVREICRIVELLAKLTGELKEQATVNVLVLPEWHGLRARILEALAPFPEARIAVAKALLATPPPQLLEVGHG